jgi:hypothetical protein
MLSLLIDIAIGLVAAGTLASLIHSARLFLPVWRRLHADLAALDDHHTIRVSICEHEVSAFAAPHSALSFRPAISPAMMGAPVRPSGSRSCWRAAA